MGVTHDMSIDCAPMHKLYVRVRRYAHIYRDTKLLVARESSYILMYLKVRNVDKSHQCMDSF
jgi:hypothetical protein